MHAFVDESYRGSEYLICAVIVRPSEVDVARRTMRKALKASQGRVHMAKENAKNKALLLDLVARLDVIANVVTVKSSGRSQRKCRDICLSALSHQLHLLGVTRLVVESCDQDKADMQVLGDELRACGELGSMNAFHLKAREEPLLWIADVIAWAVGRGGDSKRRIATVLDREIRL